MKTSKMLHSIMAAAVLTGGFTLLNAHAEAVAKHAPGLHAAHGKMAEKLELTDAQREQIKAILEAESGTLKSLATLRHEAGKILRNTIHQNGATEAAVRAAASGVAEVDASLAVERQKLYSKISPILTPAQLDKFQAMGERVENAIEAAIGRMGSRTGE